MEEDQQNQNKNEKPRYYATDFNEIKENLSDEEKLLFERYKEMLSGIIPADSASSGSSSTAMMLHSRHHQLQQTMMHSHQLHQLLQTMMHSPPHQLLQTMLHPSRPSSIT